MARRQASFGDLMEFGSKLPWRVAVLLAVSSFVGFHFLAITTSSPAAETTLASLGTIVLRQWTHIVALFFQFLAPAGLLIGALIGYIKQLRQCKQWRNEQVGVKVVRELNGVITAQAAGGGFVVTAARFTREAREFAQKTQIELLDGDALEKLIGTDSRTTSTASAPEMRVPRQSPPACPQCGTAMVQRVAKQGKHAGRSFWGCQQYPKCTGIVQIS